MNESEKRKIRAAYLILEPYPAIIKNKKALQHLVKYGLPRTSFAGGIGYVLQLLAELGGEEDVKPGGKP